jgi:hypothetical protein
MKNEHMEYLGSAASGLVYITLIALVGYRVIPWWGAVLGTILWLSIYGFLFLATLRLILRPQRYQEYLKDLRKRQGRDQ